MRGCSKLQRRNQEEAQVVYLPDGMETHLDVIHGHVERLISRYNSDSESKTSNYERMNEMYSVPVPTRPTRPI